MVPFVHGGAEELCLNLVRQLRAHGADAEAMALPFTWEPPERLIEEMLITRSLRIANADRVIALKFPAYLVEHPDKTVWLLHQYNRTSPRPRVAPPSCGRSTPRMRLGSRMFGASTQIRASPLIAYGITTVSLEPYCRHH
jgi:hypothetical protein